MNEFINLRKSPGHTHGIADQRFSRIATFILKIIVQTISLMHGMVVGAFSAEGITVKMFDCPGAIDFDQILKPCFSAELNKGGHGSHPHPTDGLDWTNPTGPLSTLLTCPTLTLHLPSSHCSHPHMSIDNQIECPCRPQPQDSALCSCVLGAKSKGRLDAVQVRFQ